MEQSITQRLQSWLALEETVRRNVAAGAGPGVAKRETLANVSGLDFLRGMITGTYPYPLIAQTLDFLLVEAEPGHVVFQGEPKNSHLNPMGTVHGGWFATLLDSAMACSVHSQVPTGKAYTTVELSIKLLRPIFPDLVRVRAVGTLIHCGRTVATAEGRLLDADGKLYAHGTTTCLIFDG